MKTPMNGARIVALLAICVLAACSSISVNADYDPDTEFGNLRTYSWLPEDPADTDPRAGNQFVSTRVSEAIERELAALGYDQVDSGADFGVGFSISVRHGIDTYSEPVYYGHYGRYGGHGGYGMGYGASTQVYEYTEGMLQIDLVDTQASTLLWRGTGSARLRENQTPEESTERINAVVAKVLGQFPPK